MTAQPTSYDEVVYPSLSFQHSHPNHLATLATLLGLRQPPVTQCRVLELGCASGGNIIPMAAGLPGSSFVGIDLSARQIAQGQAIVDELGLTNVALRHMDILDVPPDLGEFDYIIAHGIYSWVPFPVRDALLAVCARHLAPEGVAYISYNTYPGGRFLKPIRESLLHHVRHIGSLPERAAAGRDLLELLAETGALENQPYDTCLRVYANFIRRTLEQIGPGADSYLLHDIMEDVNDPVYFHEFAAHAERHGLQYLTEAEFSTVLLMNAPPKLAEALNAMSRSLTELEQYTDFVRNRMFRMTLLCREGVAINRRLRPDRIVDLLVASQATPHPAGPDDPPGSEQFHSGDDKIFTTDHALTLAAMHILLDRRPQPIPFRELHQRARAQIGPAESPEQAANDAQTLAANLLKGFCYSTGLVELHSFVPDFVLEVSDRPVAAPEARRQARDGVPVSNRRHERIQLDEVSIYLLRHMDGSRTREDLRRLLEQLMAEGTLELRPDERDEQRSPAERLGLLLDEALQALARKALLVG